MTALFFCAFVTWSQESHHVKAGLPFPWKVRFHAGSAVALAVQHWWQQKNAGPQKMWMPDCTCMLCQQSRTVTLQRRGVIRATAAAHSVHMFYVLRFLGRYCRRTASVKSHLISWIIVVTLTMETACAWPLSYNLNVKLNAERNVVPNHNASLQLEVAQPWSRRCLSLLGCTLFAGI